MTPDSGEILRRDLDAQRYSGKELLVMVQPWIQLGVLVAIGVWVGRIDANVASMSARITRIETVLDALLASTSR